MALNGQSTSNYNLYKPSLEDSPPDITATNGNWDIIDTQMKYLSNLAIPSNVKNKLPSNAWSSMEEKHIYISTTGSDSANGTASNPLKTIGSAIGRFGGTARLILHFTAGSYMEANTIEVSGCTSVEFVAVEGASVTLDIAYIQYGGIFGANGINFTSASNETRDTIVLNGVSAVIEKCVFKVKNTAVVYRNGSRGLVVECTFNNCGRALYSLNGSVIGAQTISGTGNAVGYAATASIITVGVSTLEATTLASKAGGGVIFRNGNLIGATANTFVNAT